MATHTCPDGHTSDTADFCSQCGIEMSPSAAGTPVSSPAPATTTGGTKEKCPKCSTDRDDPSSVFCGVCGYNFSTGTGGGQVVPDHEAVAATTAPAAATGSSSSGSAKGSLIDIEVTFTDDARKADAPLKFSLFEEQSIIGRKKSNPTPGLAVALDDLAISTRHLLVDYRAGSVVVRDNNSANGSKINGKDLTAGAEQAVSVGDEIAIGEFTVIKVTAIRS